MQGAAHGCQRIRIDLATYLIPAESGGDQVEIVAADGLLLRVKPLQQHGAGVGLAAERPQLWTGVQPLPERDIAHCLCGVEDACNQRVHVDPL
ncbi:hypothetical protein D3C81_1242930 [compost metagenome]